MADLIFEAVHDHKLLNKMIPLPANGWIWICRLVDSTARGKIVQTDHSNLESSVTHLDERKSVWDYCVNSSNDMIMSERH
jgi:hypothetical protein